jgi:glycosyltransferase involved in cell wall biosynthesis
MKILFINNDKGWGGGQEFLKDLSVELRKAGLDIHFVVRSGTLSEERFRNLGMRVYPMPHHGLKDLKALWDLAAIMRRERFDVISINREHDLLMTVLSRRLAFPFSRPGKLLMTYHIGIARKQFFLGSMDAIICVSEHVRARLLRLHPQVAAKTRILHNGIRVEAPPAAEKFAPGRERRFFRNSGFPLIGMIGAFWKNQAELVDCIPLLQKEFPGIKAAFIGDDTELPLATPLKEKIRKMGLGESIIFTGKIPQERLADVFFDLDLSVTTHRNEGFGLVHLESLAAGTPVVAYNEGGQVDFLREAGGALVDGGPAEFAREVANLLRDHQRRSAMGIDGYRIVARSYSTEIMAKSYEKLFRDLLEQ